MALIYLCQRIQLRFCTFSRDFFTLQGPFESHSFHAGKNKDHCLDVLEFQLDLIVIFKYLHYLDKRTTDYMRPLVKPEDHYTNGVVN